MSLIKLLFTAKYSQFYIRVKYIFYVLHHILRRIYNNIIKLSMLLLLFCNGLNRACSRLSIRMCSTLSAVRFQVTQRCIEILQFIFMQ